jgi:hypothetical protein
MDPTDPDPQHWKLGTNSNVSLRIRVLQTVKVYIQTFMESESIAICNRSGSQSSSECVSVLFSLNPPKSP